MTTRRAALEGIRVIDLTVWFQGPVAAQHLADFGAEVIHVERPKGGDQGRGVRSIKALPVGDWNQYFLVINRNKKSLAVDLKQPKGREILYRLAEKSDVFLSNLAADNLSAWGLGYEELRAVNPRLVYAVTSGYGRWAAATKPAFDMTVQALTGLMNRLGEPGQPPIYLGMGSGDAYGGLLGAFGILLALHQRRRTGKGQIVDASLYGAQLLLAAPTPPGVSRDGRPGLRAPALAPHAREPALEHLPGERPLALPVRPERRRYLRNAVPRARRSARRPRSALRVRGRAPRARHRAGRRPRPRLPRAQRRRLDRAAARGGPRREPRSGRCATSPRTRRRGPTTTCSRPTARR